MKTAVECYEILEQYGNPIESWGEMRENINHTRISWEMLDWACAFNAIDALGRAVVKYGLTARVDISNGIYRITIRFRNKDMTKTKMAKWVKGFGCA